MSEVRKWYIGVYGGEAQARPCSPAEFEIINDREGRYFVLKEDYDSAAQCFLTAAEGCVAAERRERALQQRLTAADERADVLEGLLREASDQLHDFITGPLLDRIDAALKPADGGGDE